MLKARCRGEQGRLPPAPRRPPCRRQSDVRGSVSSASGTSCFELLQHRLILGAQRCRGLHGHPGRHGVARIAPAPSSTWRKTASSLASSACIAVWIPRSSLSCVEDLLDLPGELRHAGFATPAAGAAWSGSRARLGPPGRALLGRFRAALVRGGGVSAADFLPGRPRLAAVLAPAVPVLGVGRGAAGSRRRWSLARAGSGGLRAMVRG